MCYSVANYTGCMGCILSVCVKVKLLQCCKLYWLHGLYPVTVLHTILAAWAVSCQCVLNCYSVAYYTGCMGCILSVCVKLLQCCKLYWLHGLYPVTVLHTILAAWAVSCQCVLNCYSVANYTGCMDCILSVCVKLLQCCKLYWLHGLYPVSVC